MGTLGSTKRGPTIEHSAAYRRRRFLNWFPLGVTYAVLYMGRYNLTVAKTSLGELMTKEDFGVIFGAGTLIYALSFLINGPLVDRMGGRKGILIAAAGSMAANLAMALYLRAVLAEGSVAETPLRTVLSVLYAGNMYFQSFAAVSIVKVNAHWFHVSERGGFSGIFGTMISSGIFLAFTVNDWILSFASRLFPGERVQWIVFLAPALLLAACFAVESILLKDSPGKAGLTDFDTADASSGDDSSEPLATRALLKRILTNPIILTVAAIEFCTGVLRNGVMHWFPIYAKEAWALPKEHPLRSPSLADVWQLAVVGLLAAGLLGFLASRFHAGRRRASLVAFAGLAGIVPFVFGGWGGLLFVAGVVGGNVAGWVSDLFFQSRRAPAAGGLYVVLALCVAGMIFALAPPTNEVGSAAADSGLLPGDRITAIGEVEVSGWAAIKHAVACVRPVCRDAGWDAESCSCSSKVSARDVGAGPAAGIAATLVRGGETLTVQLTDPMPVQRAGDVRLLAARPVLPMSPYFLGALVFLVSLCVIGTHGLLSGTATMDFGGRKGAATAVGVIDGFVYLGTAVQSIALGYLTSKDWSYWPPFLLPFAIVGILLSLRIWNAKPGAKPATGSKDAVAEAA